MLAHLESLKPHRPKIDDSSAKKILCIIEGDLEFRYITKIFKLYGYKKSCYELSEELIKVAWGKNIPTLNIVNKNCLFNGGSHKGRKVPFPAIDAFEIFKRDLSIFDSVFVFFDADLDKDNEVENYFVDKLDSLEISNCLLISNPCFESSLIDFCSCGNCRGKIEEIADEKNPCDKYKNNFSKLNCFDGSKHLVVNLVNENILKLKDKSSELNCVNNIIEKFILESNE